MVLQREAADGNWKGFADSVKTLQVDLADIEQIANEIRGSDSLVVVTDDGVIEDRPCGAAPKAEDATYAAANRAAPTMVADRLSAEAGVGLS